MIFIDTGAFFALYYGRDQHHGRAVELWRGLSAPLLTSNHVLDELATLLARNVNYPAAVHRLSDIYESSTFEILRTSRLDEIEALGWMRKFADQRVSFTDCLSFALMKRERVHRAFTFDRHFAEAGFDVLR